MNRPRKSMMAALATGIGLGYMAAKRQHNHKSPYQKFLDKLEDYMD